MAVKNARMKGPKNPIQPVVAKIDNKRDALYEVHLTTGDRAIVSK